MHVEVGGLKIAFERAGTGPVVALAHGFVGDARSTWGSQIDSLSDEFTVIAWDAPGVGGSSDPRRLRHGGLRGLLRRTPPGPANRASAPGGALLRRGSGAGRVPPGSRASVFAHAGEWVRRLARLARPRRGRSEAGRVTAGIAAHAGRVRRCDGTVDVLAVGRRRRSSLRSSTACAPSDRAVFGRWHVPATRTSATCWPRSTFRHSCSVPTTMSVHQSRSVSCCMAQSHTLSSSSSPDPATPSRWRLRTRSPASCAASCARLSSRKRDGSGEPPQRSQRARATRASSQTGSVDS